MPPETISYFLYYLDVASIILESKTLNALSALNVKIVSKKATLRTQCVVVATKYLDVVTT